MPAIAARPVHGARLVPMCALVIVTLAALRLLVSFAPLVWFDIDPAIDPSPFAGMGPALSLLLDVATMFCAGVVLLSTRHRLESILAIMCAPAAAIILYWGWVDFDHLWHGTAWLAGVYGGIAIMAACRSRPELRGAVLAVICGAAVAMAARGAAQVMVEHDEDVAYFRAHKAEVLAGNGWVEGSPQALAYERRLMQSEATGWGGLSNTFSTVAGAAGLVMVVMAAWRGAPVPMPWTRRVLVVAGLACLGLVLWNSSKGAIGSVAAGFVFLCALVVPHTRRSAAVLALIMVVAVWGAVAVRGVVGSSAWDERSLLFRSHYAQTALKVVADEPLLGVGPAGFQARYMVQRPLESPEEVSSPHMVVLDWVVGVGVAGMGVGAVLLAMLAWAAAAAVGAMPDPATPLSSSPGAMRFRWVALCLGAALAMSLLFEALALPPHAIGWRAFGAAAAIAVAWACTRMATRDPKAVTAALAAGAIVVIVHGQLDMALTAQSTVCWALALVGVAAAAGAPQEQGARGAVLWCRCGAAVPLVVAAAIAVGFVPAAPWQEQGIEQAAQYITSLIPAKGDTSATMPTPAQLAEARLKAADHLAQLWRKPQRTVLAAIAAEQRNLAAGELDDPQLASEASLHAVLVARAALLAGAGTPVRARLIVAQVAALERLELMDDGSVENVIEACYSALELDPRNTMLWIRLAAALRRDGYEAGEQRSIRRAIECDDSYHLDPLRQLPVATRAALEARLK